MPEPIINSEKSQSKIQPKIGIEDIKRLEEGSEENDYDGDGSQEEDEENNYYQEEEAEESEHKES
jgi:hypothetical protein